MDIWQISNKFRGYLDDQYLEWLLVTKRQLQGILHRPNISCLDPPLEVLKQVYFTVSGLSFLDLNLTCPQSCGVFFFPNSSIAIIPLTLFQKRAWTFWELDRLHIILQVFSQYLVTNV